MRLTGGVLAGLVLALAAGEADAEDWRAVSESHHDVVFVDADSVAREADGRIAFRARHRLAENDSNRDFGYDRIDLAVTGRCSAGGGDPPPASGTRKYFLRGRPVAARDWREEGLADDLPGLARAVCRGALGYRRLADLDSAMAEYGDHNSLERLAAWITGETELTGLVVQGFEMNAVTLCDDSTCRLESMRESCWLDGDIRVPTPAAPPEGTSGHPRRDSAGVVFRGRIHRSRSQGGFGHMGAMPCLVEVTGPVRFVDVPVTPPPVLRVYPQAPGSRPETVAAHRALAGTIRAAAKVGLASEGRNWVLDDLAASELGGGACYSIPKFRSASLGAYGSSLGWPETRTIERKGPAVTLVSSHFDEDLHLYLPHAEAAATIARFVRRLSGHGVADVAQKGARVTVRDRTGAAHGIRFASAAEAVLAAGIAQRMIGRDVTDVKEAGHRVTARRLRRETLTFPDEARAAEAERHMEALREACVS